MSAELLPTPQRLATPVDELTGLPFLLAPNDEVLFLMRNPHINAARRAAGGLYIDENHGFHPRLSPLLTSEDGKAVRDSRGQMVLCPEHDAYHAAFPGPPLPETAEERLRIVVFCAARYIPRQLLNFRGDSVVISNASDEDITRLQTSGEVRMIQQASARNFLTRCVLKNPDIEHIPLGLIDEFLAIESNSTDGLKRQQFLAHKLLSLTIEPLTAPLYKAYKTTLDKNLWLPAAGVGPREIVHNQLVGCNSRARARSIRKIGELLQKKFAVHREFAIA